ncbi:regulatory signaling modulator protein AmpE [Pseudomonas aeruginosa]
MTLFTTLLVLIFERLFKLGEHGSLIIVLKRSFGG